MERSIDDAQRASVAPKIIMAVAALAMIVAFFLPFVSATGDYRERLLSDPEHVQSLGDMSMTNADLADMSLCEYARSYFGAGGFGMSEEYAIIYGVLCGMPVVLTVLSLVLSLARKPVGNVITVVLLAAIVYLIVWDFGDRRIVYDGGRMAFGYAQYVYYAAAGISVVASVWLFVVKQRLKKAQKAGQQPEAA